MLGRTLRPWFEFISNIYSLEKCVFITTKAFYVGMHWLGLCILYVLCYIPYFPVPNYFVVLSSFLCSWPQSAEKKALVTLNIWIFLLRDPLISQCNSSFFWPPDANLTLWFVEVPFLLSWVTKNSRSPLSTISSVEYEEQVMHTCICGYNIFATLQKICIKKPVSQCDCIISVHVFSHLALSRSLIFGWQIAFLNITMQW